jgi:hypothetical protein
VEGIHFPECARSDLLDGFNVCAARGGGAHGSVVGWGLCYKRKGPGSFPDEVIDRCKSCNTTNLVEHVPVESI